MWLSAGVKAGMSPLPGGRQHCVIPYGTWVPVAVRQVSCELSYIRILYFTFICLEQGADCLYMVQLMPLYSQTPSSLALFKSRLVFAFLLVLPFFYWLTQVVPEKRPLNGCSSSRRIVLVGYFCLYLVMPMWELHGCQVCWTADRSFIFCASF